MYKLFRQGLQSEYDAVVNKDSETLYFCTDTKRLYKGSDLYSKEIVFLPAGQTTANVAVKDIVQNVLYITTTGVISAYDGTEWKVLYDPNSNVQNDWKQNDKTAIDYIKNRTHYLNIKTLVSEENSVDLLSGNYNVGDIVLQDTSEPAFVLNLYIKTLTDRSSNLHLTPRFSTIDKRRNTPVNLSIDLEQYILEYIDDTNIKVHVKMVGTDCFDVFIISNISKLSSEYTSKFSSIGIYIKYLGLPSYASSYFKLWLEEFLFVRIDSRYIPNEVEFVKNRITSINSSSTDKQYPSAKAVYNAINTSLTNNQSDYIENNSASPSYIKNKPFTSLSSDFLVNNGLLSLSDTKIKSIQTLGITTASANNFIRIKSVDSNNIPTGYESVDISNEFISAKGGSYSLDTTLQLSLNINNTPTVLDSLYDNPIFRISADGLKYSESDTQSYDFKSFFSPAALVLNRNYSNEGSHPVASCFLPNIWQLLDDVIDGDHRKLYVRAYGFELHRYDGGWKKNYISAEKDKLKIYNTQKLISFEGSRLENLGTPVNGNDGTTKKYVDDLIANTSKITLKTWTAADMT